MLDSNPLVSVIIPCFNAGRYLDDAVTSVRSQIYKELEIIVVDDGSDDPTTISALDRLASNGDIKLLRNPNQGVAAARNHGIGEASGDYILPLDSDDLIAPVFLETAVRLLQGDSNIGIVCCDAMLFGALSGIRRVPEFSTEHLLCENLLFATALFRKSDWQTVGGYCVAMRYGWEDWEFWISLTQLRPMVVRIPQPLFLYRIRPDSRDRSMALWQKASMLMLIVARHYSAYLRSPRSFVNLLRNARVFKRE
jgi:glycosyltransferase involved in cell wall biosynthesis